MIATRYVPIAACLFGLAACGSTAPQQQVVHDPYANTANGALYQGQLGAGSLTGDATAEYFRSQVGDTVLFAADQTTLSPEARAILTRQAEWLNSNVTFSAVLQGHAEETGTREYNLALGARRASAVQEYLVAQGVASGRIRTLSFGKERPVGICSDESCYAQNRRVITVVSDSGAGT
ncbi:peptidoglycan-associated lipoprotein Pal [Paracoccus sp. (in: a-proteobacteria)]|uniref:peptidoglycan-associated lipoprotein Pal n=1 Tax=Paracoccus sp. TaxID=267 RepID=UPI003A840278